MDSSRLHRWAFFRVKSPAARVARLPRIAVSSRRFLRLIVEVDEAYFHCGKALLRSKLWAQESQVERSSFPTLGRIVAEQTRAVDAAEADANLEEAYRTRLY